MFYGLLSRIRRARLSFLTPVEALLRGGTSPARRGRACRRVALATVLLSTNLTTIAHASELGPTSRSIVAISITVPAVSSVRRLHSEHRPAGSAATGGSASYCLETSYDAAYTVHASLVVPSSTQLGGLGRVTVGSPTAECAAPVHVKLSTPALASCHSLDAEHAVEANRVLAVLIVAE